MKDLLFHPDVVRKFAGRFERHGDYSLPQAVRLATDPRLEAERQRLESIFRTIPPEHRASLQAEVVREKNDAKHQGALFELEAWSYFHSSEKWEATFRPETADGTPDLSVTAPDGSQHYVEVLTANPDAKTARRELHKNRFLDVLDRIERPYWVDVRSITVAPGADARAFRKFVEHGLDSFDSGTPSLAGGDEPAELTYREEGTLVVLCVERDEENDTGSILGGWFSGVRGLSPTPFTSRMEKKLKKYSRTRGPGAGLLLVVGITDSVFASRGLAQTMYGPMQYTLRVGPGTDPEPSAGRTSHKVADGILVDRHGRPQWPRFGGALQVLRYWSGAAGPEVVVPAFRFVRNAWSEVGPDPDWFAELPQWALPGRDPDTVFTEWRWWRDDEAVADGQDSN